MTWTIPLARGLLALGFGVVLCGIAAAEGTAETKAPLAQSIATTPLTERVVVRDAVVRLGDLFNGLAGNEEQPVARAPAPGTQVTYDLNRLAGIARAYGVTWQPRSWTDHVVVERASQVIGQGEIENALRTVLARRGLIRKAEIELAGRNLVLHLPVDQPATLDVADLDYDERSGRFRATIVAPAGHADAARLSVSGQVFAMAEVPVPVRRVAPGEVLRKDDIEWLSMRSEQIGRNIVSDLDMLIGQEARRRLTAGQPIRSTDLRTPIAVTKGSIITMTLHTPRMQLTSKGRALDEGSIGDVVRVMNTQSKTVVEGIVNGTNAVQVTMMTPVLN